MSGHTKVSGSSVSGRDCLRPHDVAYKLGISREQVLRLMRSRKLPGFKLGGLWLVRREQLDAYLARLAEGVGENE